MLAAGFRCNRPRTIPRCWRGRFPQESERRPAASAASRVFAADARSSRNLPGGAVLAVLQHDAHLREFVADAVGFGEVPGFSSGIVATPPARQFFRSRHHPLALRRSAVEDVSEPVMRDAICILARNLNVSAQRPKNVSEAPQQCSASPALLIACNSVIAFGVFRSSPSAESTFVTHSGINRSASADNLTNRHVSLQLLRAKTKSNRLAGDNASQALPIEHLGQTISCLSMRSTTD